jgi:hypothetical protein
MYELVRYDSEGDHTLPRLVNPAEKSLSERERSRIDAEASILGREKSVFGHGRTSTDAEVSPA